MRYRLTTKIYSEVPITTYHQDREALENAIGRAMSENNWSFHTPDLIDGQFVGSLSSLQMIGLYSYGVELTDDDGIGPICKNKL